MVDVDINDHIISEQPPDLTFTDNVIFREVTDPDINHKNPRVLHIPAAA